MCMKLFNLRNLKKLFKRPDSLHTIMAIFTGIALTFAVALAAVLILCIKPEPPNVHLTSDDYLNIAQIVAYSLALVTGASAAAIAYRAHRIKEVDATNKRFNEAVRSLNTPDKNDEQGKIIEENISIRIEGVFALQRLAENAPSGKERQRVVDVLCQYLRYHRNVDKFKDNPDTPLKDDEKAIIKALVELSQTYKSKMRIDLSFTNLYFVDFSDAYLEMANFSGAHCKWAIFMNAHCKRAFFEETHCEDALFYGAHCENTWFCRTHCEDVSFRRASCKNAKFMEVYCQNTDFTGATQDGANFWEAKDLDKAIGLDHSKIILDSPF